MRRGDGRVQALWIAGRDSGADLLQFRGEAGRQLAPGIAAIRRFEQPAMPAVVLVVELPRALAHLRQFGVYDVRMERVDLHIRPAGVLVDVKHGCPRLSAVSGPEDATLLIGSV